MTLLGAATVALVGCKDEESAAETPRSGLLWLSIESLDFGLADCGGGAGESQSITLTNDGDAPLRWSASLDSGAHFEITGASSGAVEPGATETISVALKAIPSSAIAGEELRASLVIATNDVERSHVAVPLTAIANGATIELLAPSVADFGQVPEGVEAPPIAVVLKNTGNAPAAVTIVPPKDEQFGVAGDAEVELAPGELSEGLSATFTPSGPQPASAALLIEVDGPVCGKSASSVAVKGSGLAGAVGISPGTVDFGKVDCNSQAEPKVVTIYNAGNTLFTWRAELATGANFTLSQNGGGVAAGGSAQLVVSPKAIGMTENVADDGFGDTLTISTDVAGHETTEVAVKETAYGAILKYSGDPLVFGDQTLFAPSQGKALTITNDGNASVEVGFGSGPFKVDPPSGTVKSGGELATMVSYAPTNFGNQTADIAPQVDGPLCQPLPNPVPASGRGAKAAAEAISVNEVTRRRRGSSYDGGCAILANSGGRVACWGDNGEWQLGTQAITSGPNIVPGLEGIKQIASGERYNCGIDSAGDVWCWGSNRMTNGGISGALGVSNISRSDVPMKISGVANAVQVDMGHYFACALISDGKVLCWGSNRKGGFGLGNTGGDALPPSPVPNIADATAFAISASGGCAVRADQRVYCWGQYNRGQVGNGSSGGNTTPVQVSSITGITAVSGSTASSRGGTRCAMNGSGNVWCWGDPAHGQIGDGTSTTGSYTTPRQVSGITGATAIVGRAAGGCALMGDQTVRCWGDNEYGQVGDGTTSQRNSPVAVQGIDDATAIAAGGQAACAIVTGGSVKCWGKYGFGQSSSPKTLKYF